ncbi:MAG: DUF2079 domain-containing protein [Symploca sp. SIO3C6]|nr:DUF2079 domain-containing protein [Symploca sp. SIO3C6]
MKKNLPRFGTLSWIITISTIIFFCCSSIRHALFHSSAFDLGIFDQSIYLISQGKEPICSFIGFHILGDHAAWILYPLSLLYKIYPDVHWLFAVQAVALALGALPIWHLARQAALKAASAQAIAVAYLLYPLVFNLNLFDFHPEVMALPALLAAVLAARLGKIWWFTGAILWILGCKAVLALTVAAMGLWLLVFENQRLYGAIALLAGIAWFLIATQLIIPLFSGSEAAAVGRYAYLGSSVLEIAQNLLLKPWLVLEKVFSLETLEYLVLLILPIIWGVSPQHLTPLVAAIPSLVINILSESPAQRNLVHQYSLPVLPFLLLVVIASLAAGKGWLPRVSEKRCGGKNERTGRGGDKQTRRIEIPHKISFTRLPNRRWIILWSLITFLALGKYGYFWSIYLNSLDTWQATREALVQIQTPGSVLTAPQIAPHLTHRQVVKLAIAGSECANLDEFEYILLNLPHPGFGSTPKVVVSLLARIKNTPEFQLSYQRDDIYLFTRGNQTLQSQL